MLPRFPSYYHHASLLQDFKAEAPLGGDEEMSLDLYLNVFLS